MTKKHILSSFFFLMSFDGSSLDIKDPKSAFTCRVQNIPDQKHGIFLECSEPFELLSFDAVMPEHKHGMNVIPERKKINERKIELAPIIFHMPGKWVYTMTLKVKNQSITLTSEEIRVFAK